jgi:hypothetical protein
MNYLLANDEADAGVIPNSEDLDVEEDDGAVTRPVRTQSVKWCAKVKKSQF